MMTFEKFYEKTTGKKPDVQKSVSELIKIKPNSAPFGSGSVEWCEGMSMWCNDNCEFCWKQIPCISEENKNNLICI